MISKPSRHCTVELQALPSRISQVRRIFSAQLRYWRLDPLIDRVALGVTELLTNVHRHVRTDKTCTVRIELELDRLTVSVHDRDPHLPLVHEAEPGATGGRGLALIAAVSESWGVQPLGDTGKTVWFTLPTPPRVPLFATWQVPGAATTGPFAELEPVAMAPHAPARSAVVS
ncbi:MULTISPECIES: ATP-binding protein [Streptomyces]|uniref:Regulatory protein n=2 Tax=Streptomyces albus subsp. albus TaxID=67257 RepID=A0A0B5EH41_STRA4|nr:ATP-binding protein [Streptomyces sp. SCSIO ZS0520]AJE80719.1 regulatory protein [Streptomyces albus]AOU75030.1 regulatory protein [Streptomyces albus]AYN30837.1 ATP-binding protein [Streptomyces albus]CCD31828.1 regulatory protein [Streptomyces albus subsp. albus]